MKTLQTWRMLEGNFSAVVTPPAYMTTWRARKRRSSDRPWQRNSNWKHSNRLSALFYLFILFTHRDLHIPAFQKSHLQNNKKTDCVVIIVVKETLSTGSYFRRKWNLIAVPAALRRSGLSGAPRWQLGAVVEGPRGRWAPNRWPAGEGACVRGRLCVCGCVSDLSECRRVSRWCDPDVRGLLASC